MKKIEANGRSVGINRHGAGLPKDYGRKRGSKGCCVVKNANTTLIVNNAREKMRYSRGVC